MKIFKKKSYAFHISPNLGTTKESINEIKVLQFINSIKDKGGAETLAKSLHLEFREAGLGTFTLTKECFSAIPLIRFRQLLSLIRETSNLRGNKKLIILGHLTFGITTIIAAKCLILVSRSRPALIFVNHGNGSKSKLRTRIAQMLCLIVADRSIFVQRTVKFESIIKRMPSIERKIVYIPNGIRTRSTEVQRSKKFQNLDKIRLGTISRLNKDRSPLKYLEYLEESLLKPNRDLSFLIGGSGPEKNLMRKRINERGLEKRVNFYGFVTNADEFLKGIDIFVTLCIGGACGIAALEAINSGCLVIGIQLDERYKQTTTDLVKSFSSKCDFTEALDQFLVHQEVRDEEMNRQSSMLSKEYNISKCVNSYIQLFESIE